MPQHYGLDPALDALAEENYPSYLADPKSVDPEWQDFFKRLDADERAALAAASKPQAAAAPRVTPSTDRPASGGDARRLETAWRVSRMVMAWRSRGHYLAQVDPLGPVHAPGTDLSPAQFGIADQDLDVEVVTDIPGYATSTPREIHSFLRRTYAGSVGYELMHIEDDAERAWLLGCIEGPGRVAEPSAEQRRWMLSQLTNASEFESFLHKQFVGTKRFSLEGLDAAIPLLSLMLDDAADAGVEDVMMGMAHRGRLNVLINILGKSLPALFRAFADQDSASLVGRGDVKYHLGYTSERVSPSGNAVTVSLCFNPSHLEFVNPVVTGRARARLDARGDGSAKSVLPVTIHGDAAFIGQGIVIETLNLAGLEGYRTGGTIHLVLNNQVGFTTMPSDSRSSRYCTDAMAYLRAPVFHVNAEDLDAVWRVARMAVAYRQRFMRDVCIDLVGFRRHGHNEGDEPRFTQPVMYHVIDAKPSVRESFAQSLIARGELTPAENEHMLEQARTRMLADLEASRSPNHGHGHDEQDKTLVGGPESNAPAVETAVALGDLQKLADDLSRLPEGFSLLGKAEKLLQARARATQPDEALDWGTVESLAWGSLVRQGLRVRISGQDARRGTFTHRHAYVTDTVTGRRWSPYERLSASGGVFEAWDSPLSEAAVLGFEYGYAMEQPHALVIWEAQFGDFVNGAQVIIDQFIAAGEDKWNLLSGVVMLLPHGFEGQGPEHSYARLGRFLSLCAEDNMQVCDCSTPSQFFHLMRRQALRPWKKPLVVMSPKSLLRHKSAVSTLRDLSSGTFQKLIPDVSGTDPRNVRRVLLCSGRVFYDLAEEQARRGATDVHIVRVEQLYPLDAAGLAGILGQYAPDVEVLWVQDEPWNMGAWYFIKARLQGFFGDDFRISCISRAESASPATGSLGAHRIENHGLLTAAFSGVPSQARVVAG
jgi:2-oxoglutarate dehydrogenase E1 component